MSELKKIIYNCKQATFLIEKRMLGRITFRERIELHIHLLGCNVCKLYGRQSQKINQMIKHLIVAAQPTLNADFKADLQRKITERLKKK
ncbi:hypothetical protein FFF34_012015 [Inquilinus sp. KBS0705]|nr:hypothetical protein FFF34_012015 [Inquilinus sp. KBS0705]